MITKQKVILMLSIGVLYFVFDTLLQAGFFKQISNTDQIPKQSIKGVFGAEDMEWDRRNNIIYVSSTDRRSTYKGVWQASDGIYMLHPKSGETHRMKTNFSGEFHPHGISLFEQNEIPHMFIVNHFKKEHSIELFRIKEDSLIHLKTFINDLLHSPNDVVGIGVNEFYATNDHGNTSSLGIKIENYLRMPYSYLVYFDGEKYSKALEGLVYANGVQKSEDDSTLFVTHTIGHELFVLDRDFETGELHERERVQILSGLDNIDVDEQGNVWVAAHPKLMEFTKHATNRENYSPSQVYRLTPTNEGYQVRKVFENDGAMISGSSVAVYSEGSLFMGGVFDDEIVEISF